MAFTCAQVTVVDFASNPNVIVRDDGVTPVTGPVYRLVRGDVAECHSDREQVLRMACINKAVIKSCSMMFVELSPYSTYGSTSAAKAAFEVAKEEKFQEVGASHV